MSKVTQFGSLIFVLLSLIACGSNNSQEQIPGPDGAFVNLPACTQDYAYKRNQIMADVSTAFMGMSQRQGGQLDYSNYTFSPSMRHENLVLLRFQVGQFLAENQNVVCLGMVPKCKPGFENNPYCYTNVYQSDFSEQRVSNEFLVKAYEILDAHLNRRR